MRKLLIIGAKGFASELLEAVLQVDSDADVTFFDDVSSDLPTRIFERYPLIRSRDEAAAYFRDVDTSFALGVGGPALREKFFHQFKELGGVPKTIISPYAKIGSTSNLIGDGTCILTDAVVEANNQIGIGSLVHVGALISHDVQIGEFCEISPRANLLGGVTIGNRCILGTNCTILPRIIVGDNVTVGAGAVVTRDARSGLTVVGIPASPKPF